MSNNLTYTPVIKHSNGKSPFSIGNTSSKGSFSIAMLVYQRVIFLLNWISEELTVVKSVDSCEFSVYSACETWIFGPSYKTHEFTNKHISSMQLNDIDIQLMVYTI